MKDEYVLYLDESELKRSRTFAIAGIAIKKDKVEFLEREMNEVKKLLWGEVQIPLHRITDSASNGSVFPVVTEHFSASSDHAFL